MRAVLGITVAILAFAAGASAAKGPAETERGRNLPTDAPLATVGGFASVTKLDPLTLAPRGSATKLGEYHDTYSFSPDGSEVAFGISADGGPGGRIGIRLLDARDLAVTGNVRTGVYAAAVAWLEPTRLAAVLGDSFTCSFPCGPPKDPNYSTAITVDSATGATLTSRRLPHSCDTSEIRGRALLSLSERRLSIVSSDGRVDTVNLPNAFSKCGNIATSLADEEAFVVSDDGAALAQVTLGSLQLTVHDLPDGRVISEATGLDPNRLVLARRGGGIELFDMGSQSARTVDPSAKEMRVAAQELLVFGKKKVGVRAYDLDGRSRFSVLKGDDVTDLGIAGHFAYAISKGGVAVVDIRSGKIVDRSPTRFRGDLLAEHSAP